MVRQAHHDRFAVRAEPVEARTEPPIGLIVVTSDTGLCGTYNEHVLELAERFLVERPCAQVVAIGKKGSRFFGRRGIPRMKEILDWSGYYEPGRASELLDWLVERYRQSEVSGWAVAATAFISALRWKPTVVPLLPLSFSCSGAAPFQESPAPAGLPVERPAAMALPEKLIVEPDVERFAEKLIRSALEARFSRILLEAFTAEHSARMIAMKNATDNASEMIDHLTLVRNKARQASITKELIEVVSGAEALK